MSYQPCVVVDEDEDDDIDMDGWSKKKIIKMNTYSEVIKILAKLNLKNLKFAVKELLNKVNYGKKQKKI